MTNKEEVQERHSPWQQINATVYQLLPNEKGEMVNRFSFNVQSNNRMLKAGEDEQIAAQIVREHNNHEALVEAVKGVAIMLNTKLAEYESEPWAQRVRAVLERVQSQ